jgi:Tfp pilus assembly protein PilN
MLQPTPVQTEKLAALDKKIAKAMAKGDMAEVTRLMGEQQALRMAADGVRADF